MIATLETILSIATRRCHRGCQAHDRQVVVSTGADFQDHQRGNPSTYEDSCFPRLKQCKKRREKRRSARRTTLAGGGT
jgi:hypothetical protein